LETSSSSSANGANSDWTANSTATPAPGISGSIDLFQPFDGFEETGNFFGEVQVGYNDIGAEPFVVGAEVDASFSSFLNLDGIFHWRHLDVTLPPVPCARLYPPHPAKDAAGYPRPLECRHHETFQGMLEMFGDSAPVAPKR
jgi:hypothetical protein